MVSFDTPTLKPEVAPLPEDAKLPGLLRLFDSEWVWQAYCSQFGTPEEPPQHLRPRQFIYRPGARAVIDYVAERRWDQWVVEEEFAIELEAGKPERLFHYPDDPYLPGLPHMVSAADAQQLLPKYVRLHPQRLRVEAVRYRPGGRAVLRHIAGWRRSNADDVTLFVRVMPPARLERLLQAAELAEQSGFVLPRLAGCWPEGGVVWLAAVPGETVRSLIRQGKPPDPDLMLDNLAQLWAAPQGGGQALNVQAGFATTQRLFSQVLQDEGPRRAYQQAADALTSFVETWQPTALAHNDFYDDQMVVTPTGRLALVDFEETGPGDPLMDVGNLLAHLRWMASFGSAAEECATYRRRFRHAALERFAWDEHELALREAYALFRLSSNPVRQLRHDWPTATEAGLHLVVEALDGAS